MHVTDGYLNPQTSNPVPMGDFPISITGERQGRERLARLISYTEHSLQYIMRVISITEILDENESGHAVCLILANKCMAHFPNDAKTSARSHV